MSNRIEFHDSESCHSTTDSPTENKQIILYVWKEGSEEINFGYYLKGKWYREGVPYRALTDSEIKCWHELETER